MSEKTSAKMSNAANFVFDIQQALEDGTLNAESIIEIVKRNRMVSAEDGTYTFADGSQAITMDELGHSYRIID